MPQTLNTGRHVWMLLCCRTSWLVRAAIAELGPSQAMLHKNSCSCLLLFFKKYFSSLLLCLTVRLRFRQDEHADRSSA
jgi:hypothetical protein